MKRFSRLLAVLATILMLFSLAACGGGASPDQDEGAVREEVADDTGEPEEPEESVDIPDFSEYDLGDIVEFGSYPQSESSEAEPITWIVLDFDEDTDTVLLLSEYVLDCQPFEDVEWERQPVSTWLNSTFLNEAFSTGEAEHLVPEDRYGDLVCLLTPEQAEECFDCVDIVFGKANFFGCPELMCHPTAYAASLGVEESTITESHTEGMAMMGYSDDQCDQILGQSACNWWLIPDDGNDLRMADFSGVVNVVRGAEDYSFVGIRPVIQVEY